MEIKSQDQEPKVKKGHYKLVIQEVNVGLVAGKITIKMIQDVLTTLDIKSQEEAEMAN